MIVEMKTYLSSQLDWSGMYGGILHYSMIIAFSGSALLAFLYFWYKGRLDMDEEPKLEMMRDDEENHHG
jgi:hypothetical protein